MFLSLFRMFLTVYNVGENVTGVSLEPFVMTHLFTVYCKQIWSPESDIWSSEVCSIVHICSISNGYRMTSKWRVYCCETKNVSSFLLHYIHTRHRYRFYVFLYKNAPVSVLQMDAVYHEALGIITGCKALTHRCTLYFQVTWPTIHTTDFELF